MEPIRRITSRTVVLPQRDVDTDQIIPARYLKVTQRGGLGDALFADWRYDKEGKPRPDFPLNDPKSNGAQVLVAGANFGCGSSREHAPWALRDFGFRAVVSSSIADIFRSNALKNGLVPVVVDAAAHERLLQTPGIEVTIDVETRTLSTNGIRASFPLDPFARHCLLNGVDELGYLLEQSAAIAGYEEAACAR
ncbi:MAG TPA: 3-isopropylmalate dehydratase small subunit [Myxococcales bacterium]|nr:3-isopropylmalate dehydratase small subunit [Myxococcales bacterium]